jgi:hypothetical protein
MKAIIDEKAGTITFTLPLQEAKRSASGKTLVIASTHGNQATVLNYNGKPVIVGINAYVRA